MAVVSVPRPLQERLGDDAAASLVEMLRQLEDEQEERREVQKEHLFQLLEERFLRHVVESDQRTRNDLGREVSDVGTEVGAVRVDLGKQIAGVGTEVGAVRVDLGKEIADVRTEIGAVRVDLGKEIGAVRVDLGKEIGAVRVDLGKEIGAVRVGLGKEIAAVRVGLGKEIAAVRVGLGKEIADVRKEITTQTRWILVVMGGAAVLIPIMQRIMATLIP